ASVWISSFRPNVRPGSHDTDHAPSSFIRALCPEMAHVMVSAVNLIATEPPVFRSGLAGAGIAKRGRPCNREEPPISWFTETEFDDVAVAHDVVLAFDAGLARRADR